MLHFCKNKTVFILDLQLIPEWLHQKLNVVQLQKKQLVHEKEMQLPKLQLELKLQQDVDVVQLQRKVQLEEKLQQDVDVVHPQGKAQLENQHEELELKEELHEELQEEDNNIFLFYFLKLCLIEC